MSKKRDLLDMILDPDYNEPLVLQDADGNDVKFEQIATIPRKENGEDVIYVMLRPLDGMDAMADDECLFFCVKPDGRGNVNFDVVTDEKKLQEIYEIYLRLWEDAH